MQQKYWDHGIQGAIDDDMTDVLRTQTLWFWREAEEGVDLALGKQLDRLTDALVTHSISLAGSRPTSVAIALMKTCGLLPTPCWPTVAPSDRRRCVCPPGEQLEAADMNPGQNSNARAPIDLEKKWTGEMQGEVDVALRDCFVCPRRRQIQCKRRL